MPSHRSATALPVFHPTASQKLEDTHERPYRSSIPLGRSWADHANPLKVSAALLPTASQKPADAHEMAFSCGVPDGRDCCDHEEPFHPRAATAEVELLYPTASQ